MNKYIRNGKLVIFNRLSSGDFSRTVLNASSGKKDYTRFDGCFQKRSQLTGDMHKCFCCDRPFNACAIGREAELISFVRFETDKTRAVCSKCYGALSIKREA